jgi:alanine racemase
MVNLNIEGIATHFSSADSPSDEESASYTEQQIDKFNKALSKIENMGFGIRFRHSANSAAILNFPQSHFNLVRPGIMLYGATPSGSMEKLEGLKGVMSLKTRIMDIKELNKGSRVSYGGDYVAPGKRRIAILPIGYADGYSRSLSGIGEVMVRGKRAKVAGKVCMDMTMVDVTDIDGVQPGDEVYLFGGKETKGITIEEIAEKGGTIPYEVMCSITSRVPKVYAGGDR